MTLKVITLVLGHSYLERFKLIYWYCINSRLLHFHFLLFYWFIFLFFYQVILIRHLISMYHYTSPIVAYTIPQRVLTRIEKISKPTLLCLDVAVQYFCIAVHNS